MQEKSKEIDLIQYGMLCNQVKVMSLKLDKLETDINLLLNTLHKGKGIIAVLLIIAGALGSLAHLLISKII